MTRPAGRGDARTGFLREIEVPLKNPRAFPYHDSDVLRLSGLVGLGALLGVLPLACVYDGDQRCGPHQTQLDNDRCGCEVGYVPGTAGCVPCGDNEREANGACLCVDGYARAADGAACEPIPAALGAACESDATCTAPEYPLCHLSDASGYCTNQCASDGDCDGGYKCHQQGDESFCRRPPVGYGDSCKNDSDCAGGEATFCETLQKHICLVPCSAGKTDACFEGETCCDFVVFRPICVPSDACTENMGRVVQ